MSHSRYGTDRAEAELTRLKDRLEVQINTAAQKYVYYRSTVDLPQERVEQVAWMYRILPN